MTQIGVGTDKGPDMRDWDHKWRRMKISRHTLYRRNIEPNKMIREVLKVHISMMKIMRVHDQGMRVSSPCTN